MENDLFRKKEKKGQIKMSNSQIPKSIQDIIDIYIVYDFGPFTYKILADRLNIDPNTLNQRINRNPEYFDIRGQRPKIITLKKGLEDIYFYRDKNTCRICQKQKDPTNLLIRLKDPYLKDDENWENIITCCQNCKDTNLIKRLSYKKNIEQIDAGNYIWEYKEIEIREIHKRKNPYMKLYFPDFKETEIKYEHYHEFNELNGQGWHHIIDDNNERCENLSDILNYFGSQGWELVIMDHNPPEFEGGDWGNLHCVFKRKKIIEGI